MTRVLGVNVILALVTASAACGVGGGGGGGDDDGNGSNPGGPITPIDDGQTCAAHFTITGTFTPGAAARPTDPDTNQPLTGCWPAGQWDFTAAVSDNSCADTPTVLAKYSFKVDEVPSSDGGNDTEQQLTNLTSVGNLQVHVGMSSNGQGCEGSLELGSADGKEYWNLKPTLSKDPAARTLAGSGEYAEFGVNGWPWQGQ